MQSEIKAIAKANLLTFLQKVLADAVDGVRFEARTVQNVKCGCYQMALAAPIEGVMHTIVFGPHFDTAAEAAENGFGLLFLLESDSDIIPYQPPVIPTNESTDTIN